MPPLTSDNYVWHSWCDTSTASATTTDGITGVWGSWNVIYNDNSTTAGTTNDTIWKVWTQDTTIDYYVVDGDFIDGVNIQPTEEDENLRQQLRRQEEEARQEALKLQQEKEKAEDKAKQLLLDLIGEEELKIYEKTGRIFVKGNQYDYIVQKSGYVRRIEKDKIRDICIHLENRWKYPDSDNVIALKLLIEANEEKFLQLGNLHSPKPLPERLPEAACMGK